MRLKARPRLAVNHPGLAPAKRCGPYKFEVVGVGNFVDKLASFFPIFLGSFLPLLAIFVGLVFPLVDNLLDFLFFFGSLFWIERFVVFGNQSLHLLAVNFKNFVSLDLSGLGMPLAVEVVLNLTLDVGVVAFFPGVLFVLVGYHAKQLLHLLLRQRAVGAGS